MRHRRNRGSRGAALVEALVVLPFFILIFAGIGYLGKLYSTRQVVGVQARKCAWMAAYNACPSSGVGVAECSTAEEKNPGDKIDPNKDFEGFPNKDENPEEVAAWDEANGDPKSDLTREFGSVIATAERESPGLNYPGMSKKTARASNKVMCNEPGRDFDFGGLASATFHIIRDAVPF